MKKRPSTTLTTIEYDVVQLRYDMTCKGWLASDLARRAKVSAMTVSRFLDGSHRTAPMAAKLARALGYAPQRYVVRPRGIVAA